MPSKTWGIPLKVTEHIVIDNADEVGKGKIAYVFGQQARQEVIEISKWQAMVNGDLTEIKNQIERDIQGSKVRYISVSWTKAESKIQYPHNIWAYEVDGFKIEAIVENVDANLTGAEIVLIIMAIGFLVGIIALLGVFVWTTWQVMSAAADLGPLATVGIGMLIIVIVAFVFIVGLGGGFKAKGKKGSVSLGK